MQFESLNEFFAMGGYAFNVWSVYLLFIVFFGINLYVPVLRRKQILTDLKRRMVLREEDEARATRPSGNSAGSDADRADGQVRATGSGEN